MEGSVRVEEGDSGESHVSAASEYLRAQPKPNTCQMVMYYFRNYKLSKYCDMLFGCSLRHSNSTQNSKFINVSRQTRAKRRRTVWTWFGRKSGESRYICAFYTELWRVAVGIWVATHQNVPASDRNTHIAAAPSADGRTMPSGDGIDEWGKWTWAWTKNFRSIFPLSPVRAVACERDGIS